MNGLKKFIPSVNILEKYTNKGTPISVTLTENNYIIIPYMMSMYCVFTGLYKAETLQVFYRFRD